MRKRLAVATVIVASMVSITVALLATQGYAQTRTDVKKRLLACGSFLNGSTVTVSQTTHLSINLPKEIYPAKILKITPHGALAGFNSNGGNYGYGFTAPGKVNCWSYYFEFKLAPGNQGPSGTVDITSKSIIRGTSSYLIHIKVLVKEPDPISTSTAPSNGIVRGQVLLGPICPVERIPPDPACAPKPYKTRIDIQYATTVAPYKSIATDSSGAFTLSLDPGVYVLRAASGSIYPRCSDFTVRVIAGRTQSVILNCDTGIR